jgi:hypothetical protein
MCGTCKCSQINQVNPLTNVQITSGINLPPFLLQFDTLSGFNLIKLSPVAAYPEKNIKRLDSNN